jgi:U3 small nucleolar RNA-associated protein 12
VLALGFDRARHGARLASGGSDGSVVLWDVVAETGLFRLLGHRAGITNVLLVPPTSEFNTDDILVTTSLDGLVKIWDLNGQYCRQTLACHKGEVWGAACSRLAQFANDDADKTRWRLVTSDDQHRARVWSLHTKPNAENSNSQDKEPDQLHGAQLASQQTLPTPDQDDVCRFIGYLPSPPNAITAERIAAIRFHPKARFVGVLPANSKNLIIYSVRSIQDSLKKKQRRLKRRKTKLERQQQQPPNESGTSRKRGILDDDDSEEEHDAPSGGKEGSVALEEALDPEQIKASDEFEYFDTVKASHKIRDFTFVSGKGAKARIACALSTNALEIHELHGQ